MLVKAKPTPKILKFLEISSITRGKPTTPSLFKGSVIEFVLITIGELKER